MVPRLVNFGVKTTPQSTIISIKKLRTRRSNWHLDEALGRKVGMANTYGNFGVLYATRGDLDRAEEMYLKSLELFRHIGARRGIEQVEGDLAKLRDQKQ